MSGNGSGERSLADEFAALGGAAIAALDREVLLQPDRPVVLLSFKVKLPQVKHADVLVVLNGLAEDGTPMVAFMGGDSVARALRKAVAMYEDGSLKWRIDEWRVANG